MDMIKYETSLKAKGDDYKRIVFWNRFIRNPIETILTITPAIISICLLVAGYYTYFLLVIYAVCVAYPLFIFLYQFKSSVNYHLKHRDPAEEAKCIMTVTKSGILADIPEYDLKYNYEWNDCTTAYYKYGYYMLFNGSKMIVMFNTKDMTQEEKKAIPQIITDNVDKNKCAIKF